MIFDRSAPFLASLCFLLAATGCSSDETGGTGGTSAAGGGDASSSASTTTTTAATTSATQASTGTGGSSGDGGAGAGGEASSTGGGGASAARCPDQAGGCARAEVEASLECVDDRLTTPITWTTTATLGFDDEVSSFCRSRHEGDRVDLEIQVVPVESSRPENLYVRIPFFTGAGTYEIIDEEDIGDADTGLTLTGRGAADQPTGLYTARAGACGEPCIAEVTGPASIDGLDRGDFDVAITCEALNDFTPPDCESGIECSGVEIALQIGCSLAP